MDWLMGLVAISPKADIVIESASEMQAFGLTLVSGVLLGSIAGMASSDLFHAKARYPTLKIILIGCLIGYGLGCGNSTDDSSQVDRSSSSADENWRQGNNLFEKGQYEKAATAYDRCLSISPDHLDCLFNKGVTLIYLDRLEESQEVFDKLIKLKPDYPEAKWYGEMLEGRLENAAVADKKNGTMPNIGAGAPSSKQLESVHQKAQELQREYEQNMQTAKSKAYDRIKQIMTRGGDIDVMDNEGTPLHWAALYGFEVEAKWLIEQGANVNAKRSDGSTPLFLAASFGHEAVARVLIANDADVNTRNPYGYTPLFAAALDGHESVAELLIAHGADIEQRDEMGATPLFFASLKGHANLVRLLIAHGADVNAKARNGEGHTKTPLALAEEEGHADVIKLLIDNGAKSP